MRRNIDALPGEAQAFLVAVRLNYRVQDLPAEVGRQLAREATRQGISVDQFILRAALHQIGEPTSDGGAGFGVPSVDPELETAGARTRAAAADLEALGITDRLGHRRRTDLPEDMRAGADRDFGG